MDFFLKFEILKGNNSLKFYQKFCKFLFTSNSSRYSGILSPSFVFSGTTIAGIFAYFKCIVRLRANGRNNSQHCCAKNVGSYCLRVGSGVQTDATTPNKFETCSASWEVFVNHA